jgi:hypothetical protein
LFFFALLAEFPDDALFSELAVAARVGAGLTMIKAFLAISDLHLVAFHSGIPIRVIKAFHRVPSHSVILCKAFIRLRLNALQIVGAKRKSLFCGAAERFISDKARG